MKNISNVKIGFIGAGNMAEALVAGIIKSGVSASSVTMSDINTGRLDYMAGKYGVAKAADNAAVMGSSGVVFLCVKPFQIDDVMKESAGMLSSVKILVSIAAGIKTSRIEKYSGKTPLIRVMPNTPALIGEGAFAICCGKFASIDDLELAGQLLSSCGIAVNVAEELMDAVTAVSGSGPAYVFYFAEIMRQAAEKAGLDKATAKLLVNRTMLGSARMLEMTGDEPQALRARVTSKGGTTSAALDVLKNEKFSEIFEAAIFAALKRSKEMSNE
jgi:pyrroline-5-carboxylate reductase